MSRAPLLLAVALFGCAHGALPSSRQPSPAKSTVALDGVAEPDFDRIDRAHPERYLALDSAFGDNATILRAAAQIPNDPDPVKQLLAIGHALREQLKLREADAYAWRDVPRMLQDGTFGGCADHALVFGAMSRAKGIPTVWVKTLDVDFMRELARQHGNVTSYRGHVFLEVFIERRWVLLDATNLILYRDYDPAARILPGNRYAYDKGGDPFALVLSPRWEVWKRQTEAFVGTFDVGTLPVGRGEPLERLGVSERLRSLPAPVFIVGNRPFYGELTEKLGKAGVAVGVSFNTDFDGQLPKAVGHTLLVLVLGSDLVLPAKYWPKETVIGIADVNQRMAETERGVFDRKRADGTRILVLYGRTPEDLERAIESL